MFYYVQSFLIIAIEILCAKIFFETFAIKREENKKWKSYGAIFAIMLLVFFSAVIFRESIILKQVFVIFSIAALMFAYLKISFWESVVLSMLFEGVLLVLDYLSFLFIVMLFEGVSEIERMYAFQGHLLTLFSKIVLFLVTLIIRKKFGKDSSEVMMDTEWLRFIAFPIFTICVIAAMIGTSGGIKNQKQEDVFIVIAVGLVGLNIIIFYLINDIVERERRIQEDKIFRLKVKNQTEMYRSISENFDKQRRKTHEYKNQIMCMESLLEKKNYAELEEYIKNISGNLSKERNYLNTNNVFVDAILNTKFREIEEKGIVLVFKINELSELSINDEDIVIILSNLLNNAIEACEKCKGQKLIKIKFVKEEREIIISVKNTYDNKIVYHEGEIQTSKSNLDEHGIGIKNIIDTIAKYDGSYVIQSDGYEFYFSIIIPI
ncbi:MAG: GHKL domain-containing protein [Lachnospiraceae bacterium]|nr:GHKL domain-containing protein [Lachnospiraceae bacterium]